MSSIQSHLGKLGPCFIDTSYQNNVFCIGYGQNIMNFPLASYNQMSHLINATYESGEWQFEGWEPDPQNPGGRVQCTVPKQAQEWTVQAILGSPTLRGKLEKWRKDAVKRLEKSVPRLKSEYEAASKRLDALRAVSF